MTEQIHSRSTIRNRLSGHTKKIVIQSKAHPVTIDGSQRLDLISRGTQENVIVEDDHIQAISSKLAKNRIFLNGNILVVSNGADSNILLGRSRNQFIRYPGPRDRGFPDEIPSGTPIGLLLALTYA